VTRKVFVDTGAWLALADASDDLHHAARSIYPSVLQPGVRLITTNLVVAESYNLIRRRIGFQASIRFLQSLRTSPRLERVYSDARLENAAEEWLQWYEDQDFSLVDAVSFAYMQVEGIGEAFAFDKHFTTAGFVLVSL
jgi:predicted nucleic acid-binding protein